MSVTDDAGTGVAARVFGDGGVDGSQRPAEVAPVTAFGPMVVRFASSAASQSALGGVRMHVTAQVPINICRAGAPSSLFKVPPGATQLFATSAWPSWYGNSQGCGQPITTEPGYYLLVRALHVYVPAVAFALTGCSGTEDSDPGKVRPEPEAPQAQDIQTTDLDLNLGALTGTATLVVRPAAGMVTLDVAGLTLSRVTVDGVDAPLNVVRGVLSVAADADAETVTGTVTVVVDYSFNARTPLQFDGWMPNLGVTFLWPNYCSNLFPCNPALEDGLTFTMNVTGVDDGLTAIYPTSTHGDGPPYMAGVAVGDAEQVTQPARF